MKAKHVIPILAAVSAVTCATAATSASAATTGSQSATSANWSGYVASGTASGTAQQFSSVSGSWVEPSANCTTGQDHAAFWVGLGGAGGQSQSLEQVGTEADCSSGAAAHFAWYELVPAAPVRLDLTISPGDHVSGSVSVNGTNVTVSLSDQTTGASTTKALQMSNPDVSSAEWIAEAPSACDGSGNCQPLPLANFGNVSFTNASATADGHTGTISDPNWTTQTVALNAGAGASGSVDAGLGSAQSSAGATPSGLSTDGSSFSVAWASGASQTSGSGVPSTAGGYPSDGYSGGYGNGGSGYGGYGYGGGYAYGGVAG